MGFLRGGPLGALVGGAVQHVMTKKVRKLIRKGLPGVVDEPGFVTCIIVVMTKVTMAKGTMTPREVEIIYQFFVKNLNYSESDLDSINEIIRETWRVNPDLNPVIQRPGPVNTVLASLLRNQRLSTRGCPISCKSVTLY